jgi:hypothetical protein
MTHQMVRCVRCHHVWREACPVATYRAYIAHMGTCVPAVVVEP